MQSLQVVQEVDVFFSDGDSADVAARIDAPALMGDPSESSLIFTWISSITFAYIITPSDDPQTPSEYPQGRPAQLKVPDTALRGKSASGTSVSRDTSGDTQHYGGV